MSPRVLISESDWRLLQFAYGDLRQHGYEVIVEASPLVALGMIAKWQPQVIIASSRCLEEWQQHSADWLTSLGSSVTVLVTADAEDSDCTWQAWADRGCDVLFKPLVHASELRVATDQALAARRVPPPTPSAEPDHA